MIRNTNSLNRVNEYFWCINITIKKESIILRENNLMKRHNTNPNQISIHVLNLKIYIFLFKKCFIMFKNVHFSCIWSRFKQHHGLWVKIYFTAVHSVALSYAKVIRQVRSLCLRHQFISCAFTSSLQIFFQAMQVSVFNLF